MSPTKNLMMSLLVMFAACGSSDDTAAPDAAAPCVPPASGTAPTYTELFSKYFAPNTPGHCANAECHGQPGHIWVCGTNKDTCYNGMVKMAGIVDPGNPTASVIADPARSPLRWVNKNGVMPYDNPTEFPEGRDAIVAWVAACAQNN